MLIKPLTYAELIDPVIVDGTALSMRNGTLKILKPLPIRVYMVYVSHVKASPLIEDEHSTDKLESLGNV